MASLDPEIKALTAVERAIKSLTPGAARRVLRMAVERQDDRFYIQAEKASLRTLTAAPWDAPLPPGTLVGAAEGPYLEKAQIASGSSRGRGLKDNS